MTLIRKLPTILASAALFPIFGCSQAHSPDRSTAIPKDIESTPLRVVSDLAPKRRSSILALEGANFETTRRIHRRLRDGGVITSMRENLIRLSPNLYNDPEHIDRVLSLTRSVVV